jgi:hypothetical protein
MKSKAFAVVVSVILPAVVFAGSDSVKYEGGTVPIKDGTELRVDLTTPDAAVFAAKGQVVRIPWAGIKTIEYGQTASRRVTSAILLSPIALFSKARKHYVSVEWTDEQGQAQAAAFRADKNNFRSILTALRAKSGQVVTCGDVEAAKYFPCENAAELVAASTKK